MINDDKPFKKFEGTINFWDCLFVVIDVIAIAGFSLLIYTNIQDYIEHSYSDASSLFLWLDVLLLFPLILFAVDICQHISRKILLYSSYIRVSFGVSIKKIKYSCIERIDYETYSLRYPIRSGNTNESHETIMLYGSDKIKVPIVTKIYDENTIIYILKFVLSRNPKIEYGDDIKTILLRHGIIK